MAISIDQTASGSGNGATSLTVTFSTLPTVGAKCILMIWQHDLVAPTVVDNGSVVRTFILDTPAPTQRGAWIFRADDIRPSGSYSVQASGFSASTDIEMALVTLLGAAPGAPIATAHGNNAGSTAASSGAAGSGAGNYYAAVLDDSSSGNPATITNTWAGSTARLTQLNGSVNQVGQAADLLGSGSQNATWTIDSAAWDAMLAVYAAQPVLYAESFPRISGLQ
jgi:hypothetical protein